MNDLGLNEQNAGMTEKKAVVEDNFSALPVAKAEKCDSYPVSSTQKRMYILWQLAKTSKNYNIPGAVLIQEKADPYRIEEIFQKLVARHTSLRTSFEMHGKDIVQIVHDDIHFEIHYEDVKDSPKEIDAVIRKFIRPFKLSVAPLFRVKLCKLAGDKYILLTDAHSIVFDEISSEILMREFSELYAEKKLSELKYDYVDYSVWENNRLKKGMLNKQEEYWMKIFEEEIPKLELPAAYPRPAVRSYDGARYTGKIDINICKKIRNAVRENSVTLQILLISAYFVMLSKYSGTEDIAVGIPVYGREKEEFKNVIGTFNSTLPLRNQISGDMTFRKFLKNVKEKYFEAYDHRECAFDELADKIGMFRDPGRNPVFDTVFRVLEMSENAEENELMMSEYPVGTISSKYDMTWTIEGSRDALYVSVDYCTGLFDEMMIRRYFDSFTRVLDTIPDNIDIRIEDITVTDKKEENRILSEFNNDKKKYDDKILLHELFEQMADRYPDETAVIFEDKSITYRELDQKSNSLARVLRNNGVSGDCVVAIMLNRSIEMAVGLLAILKSGGAYLPIDPGYPESRKEYLLSDSKAKILLTTKESVNKTVTDSTVVYVDSEETGEKSTDRLPRITDSTNLAYIIYTSGSTGKPKGVMVEHRNIVNTQLWRRESQGFGPGNKVLQFLSVSFDGFVSSFFTPLVSGATVVMMNDLNTKDPIYMSGKIIEERITHMTNVPVMYKQLLSMGLLTQEKTVLKAVTLGGEKIDSELSELSRKILPNVEVINEYGPTECAVNCTCLRDAVNKEKITIGKPITNAQVYILDKYFKPVPVGVRGEICVSGAGVTRGYFERDELTKERFIDWKYRPGTRLYRTGDLGKWTMDGEIEFLGRMDDQVKIHGYRIELGEIEEAILSLDFVSDCVVIVHEFDDESKELNAYYVSSKPVDEALIKRNLLSRLPKYMVPAKFVALSKMPLTPNGKIDHKAIQAMSPEKSVTVKNVNGPVNETEKMVSDIIANILHLDALDRTADFFDMGGDSMGIISIQDKLLEKGIKVSVSLLYENRTVENIAHMIDSEQSE